MTLGLKLLLSLCQKLCRTLTLISKRSKFWNACSLQTWNITSLVHMSVVSHHAGSSSDWQRQNLLRNSVTKVVKICWFSTNQSWLTTMFFTWRSPKVIIMFSTGEVDQKLKPSSKNYGNFYLNRNLTSKK